MAETCTHRVVVGVKCSSTLVVGVEVTCKHRVVEVEMSKCRACSHHPLRHWQSCILPRHRPDEAKNWPS